MSIVVAGDMYDKWPEAVIVDPLTFVVTAEFLHDNVVCRFSETDLVYKDRGPEYRRQFVRYCRIVGIR